MPSFDQLTDLPKKGKIIKSAFDSESFEADGAIHVDGLVGSATISPSGRDIALASPDGLAIIDLDSPYNPPRRLRSHGMPWLVVDVQWSPFAARDYWVVSTANHRALVWNLNLREDSSSGAIEHSLQGHSRAITDINFSAHHPDHLATCSVDGYVHCWDLRRPRQPALTFCDWFAGATQVKYNRQDPHILASAHDRLLHIWDERRASKPLKSISAHTSKIYGVDWNRTRSTGIVTCSLDKSIKFWDYEKDAENPEHVIRTEYPVWRARHTPFGWGLLAMPQNEPGELHLYDRRWENDSPVEVQANPVAVFPGHGARKAKEFLWRSRGGISEDGADNREFQIVSWGADNELRLHCVDTSVLSSVGHEKGGSARKGWKLTRKGAIYKTFRTMDDSLNRDKMSGTMSDPRPTSSKSNFRQSALTLGMRSAAPHSRSAASWRGPSMRAKVASSKESTRNQSQIGWMKGISMTKRKASTEPAKRHASKDAAIFGPGYPDDEWGEPDTIQEELLRISTQIPKVKWENIDLDNLTLNASLNGPWGAGGETIFVKVKIDIPTQYPKSKGPKFSIEKTSFMPEETHKRIHREIHQLAGQFLQRKQNCLEVAFTYLLGEVDLESSTTFFKNVRDLDDDVGGLEDESSSEEDEDIAAEGAASMSQELVPHEDADTALATPRRTIVPPSPRTCGARFSLDGRLICFFPSKEEKARATFSVSADPVKERPKGEPFFAGFGRMSYDLPPKHKTGGTGEGSATEDNSDDSDSDESSSSATDSESTSTRRLSLWYHPRRQLRKTWSEDRSVRSSGGGTGTGIGTGTGTATSRRRPGKPRNVISIHDFRRDLPSKQELASEYAIFGDGEDVCTHNALVAEKHNYTDLANVWRYLALLLRTGIPLEILETSRRGNSILVIAKDVVTKYGAEDSLPSLDGPSSLPSTVLSGRVKWGEHPLAKDFISDLFDYFEKTADIQMLATLSCIFSESFAEDSVAYVESQLPQPATPLPLKAPSFSLDYFPTDASAMNIYGRSHANSAATTPGTLHTPIQYGGSQVSDDATWNGEPSSNSYSCGETPPSTNKMHMAENAASTLSRSPSNRPVPRSNSGLASTFAANLPLSFTGTSSASPPGSGKKKPSPVEMILSSLGPGASKDGWIGSMGMADSSGGRTSLSDDDYHKAESLPLVPVDVFVIVEDQVIFDDDGWLNTPLLEPSRAPMHADYRYAYAEMLQMWNQPLARLEIMKFNVLREDVSSGFGDGSFHDSVTIHDGASGHMNRRKSGSTTLAMGRKDQLQALLASGRGLDVTGVCRTHETQLEPVRYNTTDSRVGGAVGVCDRCRRSQSQLRCVYCLEPVDALYPPCLSCGCASHEGCLADWHAAGEVLCPAGDECNCAEQAANGQVESWAALQGAMLKGLSQAAKPPAVSMGDGGREAKSRPGWERAESSRTNLMQGFSPSAAGLTFGRLKRPSGSWSRSSSEVRGDKRGT